MRRTPFIGAIVLSWGLALAGAWIAGEIATWLGVLFLLLAILTFNLSSFSRGRATGLPKTAKWAAALYLLAPFLAIGGVSWAQFHFRPPVIATVMVGAGIWSVGFAWMCVAALWNGGWYVAVRK